MRTGRLIYLRMNENLIVLKLEKHRQICLVVEIRFLVYDQIVDKEAIQLIGALNAFIYCIQNLCKNLKVDSKIIKMQ